MTIMQGETYPPFMATLTDDTGAAVNLTGATVKLRMANASNGINVINDAAVTVTDEAAGTVEYDWQAGDVDTPGLYFATVWVTTDDGLTPYPNNSYIVVEILPALAVGT